MEDRQNLENLNSVVAYINEARSVGLSQTEIMTELMRVGWTTDAIKLAFIGALRVTFPQNPQRETFSQPVPRPIIEVVNLTKKYGTFTAVDGISFSVNPGETFGILGPNGAGKTTTLEMIEGIKGTTYGTILLDGKDVTHETHAVKSVIGVQLQASSFFDELTLRELLETFGTLYDRTVDAMKLLADVQLTDKANSFVKELSGGQKQRFSIAVALVNDPKVIFLDEPTTGLDPQARRNLWDLVTSIKQRGKTIVLTTHYMEEAEILCDRIAIMDHAKIVALDTTSNLLTSVGIDATIEFTSTHTIDGDILRAMHGVQTISHHADRYSVTTTHPQRTLDELFSKSREYAFEIDELTMKRATLEDAFLKLTGHQLRD